MAATSISPQGWISGAQGASPTVPIVRNPNGTITQLTLPSSATAGGVATSCNDHGMAAGFGFNSSNNPIALVWTSPGSPTVIGDFGGGKGEALGINNNGEVVGFAYDSKNVPHPFTWTSTAGLVDLSTALGGTGYIAASINDSGVIVGYASTTGKGFIYTSSSGQVSPLLTDGGAVSDALAVNSAGEAVGTATDTQGAFHSGDWNGSSSFSALNVPSGTVLSQANGVNASGVIVGNVELSSGSLACRWLPSSTAAGDILDTITSGLGSGVMLSGCAGVDANGDIVCEGSDGKAYLLQPSTSPNRRLEPRRGGLSKRRA